MEPTPAAPQPQPTNNYDFILNPEKPSKRGLLGGIGGDSFVTKILFIVGGAIVLMVVASLLINLLFGSGTNLNTIVSLAQTEEEIARLGGLGEDAGSQEIKNAAITTQLTLKSHQIEWLAFLKKNGREVKNEELKLRKDASSDKRLATAKQASLFDNTYTSLMRTELKDYATSLKSAYDGASNKQERAMLSDQYNNVVLLLKQWPELNVGLLAD